VCVFGEFFLSLMIEIIQSLEKEVKLTLGYSLRKLENLGTLKKSGTVRSCKVSASGWLATYEFVVVVTGIASFQLKSS